MSVSGCTVSYLVSGGCAGDRAEHHFHRESVRVCAAHAPAWAHLREIFELRLRPRQRVCRHGDRTAEARAVCERRRQGGAAERPAA